MSSVLYDSFKVKNYHAFDVKNRYTMYCTKKKNKKNEKKNAARCERTQYQTKRRQTPELQSQADTTDMHYHARTVRRSLDSSTKVVNH